MKRKTNFTQRGALYERTYVEVAVRLGLKSTHLGETGKTFRTSP
jgi:hypothetical protein